IRCQLALHHHLGRDAGVVHAGLPQGVEALHPLPADEDVLKSVVEGVTDVEGPGYVGGRNDDAVWATLRKGVGPEVTPGLPQLVPAVLDQPWIVSIGERRWSRWRKC